ncbi:Glycosyltransferase, catalytic subunit of cellulose synthase and poly-beta-1,6-N-acetylglucosamine synthase [Halogranum amylolyticum]|uniref:Glycosyltransferase, catalytic subunit of cellulose synthase and poly-beta-1,6-N-acetylglucosamine synthase n=1 Tax=Halogranum amylolyticum TaxID=660520 RepID=A0A1H8STV5_9EURY|nr:glycosyltransferase [Halogranum amylolyticum]SEO82027.1 Glycosyltransferase, catalytic subunit of cellulose synthase and poly-beta-1,6-N-acetylglucosamine synthase [Halogranum amylolyticum]
MNALVAVAVLSVGVTALPYLGYVALYALVRPSGSPATKRACEPTVSIVLPTYNEAAIVERKLDDLLALDYPASKLELVLADASDDGTAGVVRSYLADRDGPSLTVLHDDERRGVAPALNDAFQQATGDVVFRTDADSALAPDVLREAVANLADADVGAVTGQQTEVLGDSEVEADYRGILAKLQSLESHLDSTFIFHGPCFAFRREAFVPIDPESLADDTEVALRIRRGGCRVVMDPALQFTESGVSEFRKRRQRKDRRAMGLLKLLVQHRDMLGRYGPYGRVVLPFNWWFMIVSPWLFVLDVLLVTAAAVSLVGPFGLLVPLAVLGFGYLGQRDGLGPLQPLYAVVDSQVSLLVASVKLLRGEGSGVWEIDRESREAFE